MRIDYTAASVQPNVPAIPDGSPDTPETPSIPAVPTVAAKCPDCGFTMLIAKGCRHCLTVGTDGGRE